MPAHASPSASVRREPGSVVRLRLLPARWPLARSLCGGCDACSRHRAARWIGYVSSCLWALLGAVHAPRGWGATWWCVWRHVAAMWRRESCGGNVRNFKLQANHGVMSGPDRGKYGAAAASTCACLCLVTTSVGLQLGSCIDADTHSSVLISEGEFSALCTFSFTFTCLP